MKMTDQELTRQDEDISQPEFADEERNDGYNFGNWPEIAGFLFTLFVIWLIFAFRG